jgi:D-galactarolactone cycloisomerase
MYTLSRWYGRKGAALSALGGVDSALWDLRGKLEGKPVYELLGGSAGVVDAYASDLLWEHDVTALTAKAQGLLEKGFRNVKMRTGLNPDYDRAAVRAVQAGVEDHASILVDGAKRYPLDEAIDMAHFLGDEGVLLFEEPFKPGQIDDYVALTQVVEIPIAQGENEFGVEGFRELFRAGCVGVAQPDACRTGGITETVRIARLAAEFGIPVITHTWSDAISIVANAHVVAAMPNGRMVEINQTDNPLVEKLLAAPLQLEDGKLVLPPGPGLGIELDEDLVDELTLPPGEPVPLGHYSDMTFGDEYDWMWEPYPAERLVERPEFSRS